jgi:AraC-like DNA-binding protein
MQSGNRVMLGRFVGRTAEVHRISQILLAGETLWITGPAGIGKSRLAIEASGGRRAVYLDGHFMATPAEAVPYLGEVLGASSDTTRLENVAVWLSSSLAALAAHAEVLIVEDFHLAARPIANLLLRIFRRNHLGYPVLVIGRQSWSASELVGDNLHHLQLAELSEADTQQFAGDYQRSADEVPPAAVGHPLLMHLFFRDGSPMVDEWTDSLLGELTAHCALLMRLVVAHSPVQLGWALQGSSAGELEVLRQMGIFRRRRGTFRPIEDAIRRMMEDSGQREDLERELLGFLAARPTLSERDLARALQLAIRYTRNGVLADLLERHAAAATLVQTVVVSVLRDRQIPAKVKLNSFHALAEHITLISAEDFLQVHDDLIGSADTLERRVAQTSFLRAAVISGYREWPEEANAYLEEILQCPLLPNAAKEQILHLWAFRALHACRRPEDLHHALEMLAQHGIDASTLRAYRLLFAGVELTCQYRLIQAVAMLRDAAAAFAACGHRLHVAQTQRYMLGLYFCCWQPAEFRALLAEIDAASGDKARRDFRHRFFKTVDAWSCGDSGALVRAAAGASPEVPRCSDARLRGPYLVDCQPLCYRVILDRASNAPIVPEIAELFVDLLRRTMLSIPLTVASVCLAQHAWLADDDPALARLCAALQTLGSVGEVHALLLTAFRNLAADLVDADEVLDLLDRAWLLREPLATSYYVVIAARLIHDHRLATSAVIDRLRHRPEIADMPIRARWVIEAAAVALGAAEEEVVAPDEVRLPVTAQVHGVPRSAAHAPVANDPPVSALKQLIDQQWFEQLKLESFARAHNLSRFAISRRFKTVLGRSPRQYLQETRIQQAKRKLVETTWTVTDIAYECGFSDAAQFSRLFKEATGMTPVSYRESMANVARDS